MQVSDLLADLNDQQREAVTHAEGPLLIVAGAGTGKTTVITKRIAWLIDQGHAKPENILALTFTDKAAAEMEERIDILLPYGYVDLQVSTFHAFAEKLLREFGAEIGLSTDFRVLTELDAWLLSRRNLDRFDLDYYRPLGNPAKYLRGLLTHFSRAKDDAIFPQDYVDFAQGEGDQGVQGVQGLHGAQEAHGAQGAEGETKRILELANAYHTYQQILLENDTLDFGDLMLYTLKLLRERPHVRKQIRQRYTHVLVDEFQDTNLTQYEIVRLIAEPKNQLTVVGDDDQAIYKFRGASLDNLLHVRRDFPGIKTIVLTQNYRSGQQILDHAYRLICQNNPNRLEVCLEQGCSKQLQSNIQEQGTVEHLHFDTLEDESRGVAEKIIALKKDQADLDWSAFAILVRSNDTAIPFLAELERQGIPYHFHALRGLYAKSVILDVLAALRVIDSPFDSPSVYRVLSREHLGISPLALSELNRLAQRKGKSLYEACRFARSFSAIEMEDMQRVEKMLDILDRLRAQANKRPVCEIFLHVLRDTGMVERINGIKDEKEKQDTFRYLQQFYARVKRFEESTDEKMLHHFLAEFAHERDAGEEGQLAFDLTTGPETVHVMTVHAAKGLEFPYVFLVSLIDRKFPTQARGDAIPLPEGLLCAGKEEGTSHLEEERRLFYVGMTRAKRGLYLTSAADYGGARKRKPSRFLQELGLVTQAADPSPLASDPLAPPAPHEPPAPLAPLSIPLPKQFSFTQLAAFRTCPLQYKFAHVLGIPVFGKHTFSFGKSMHNTLQKFFSVWLERTARKQGELFSQMASPSDSSAFTPLPVSLEELLCFFEESWQDDWYKNDAERETYRSRGRDALKGAYAQMVEFSPAPLFVERGFTLKIGEVVLKGRIDRIDSFEGGVEIVDYKTGRAKTLKDLAKEDKEQLYLYQIAVSEIFKLEPKRLTYHFLEDNSRVSFLAEPKELEDLKTQARDRAQQIRGSVFAPNPGMHCGFCDFKDICEYRER